MERISTQILQPDDAGLTRAAQILAQGGLVAFPTETVYGLGGDARNDHSVARIFAVKGRPQFNPLIVHLPDMDSVSRIADLSAQAQRLASAFWPGPLTLVLPLRADSGLSSLVTSGLDSVAVRVPEHPVARALLARFDGPLAAPSANPSGRISPTRADHVSRGLGERIEAIIDGGPCAVGVESTIIGMTGRPTLLRPGGLPVEAIEACLGAALARHDDTGTISAPGQLASHYAPGAPVRLNAAHAEPGELWLGFGPDSAEATLNLSQSGDLVQAAANLFHHLHALDAMALPGQRIAVAPVPEHGLGIAINDRLRRAAAPRG